MSTSNTDLREMVRRWRDAKQAFDEAIGCLYAADADGALRNLDDRAARAEAAAAMRALAGASDKLVPCAIECGVDEGGLLRLALRLRAVGPTFALLDDHELDLDLVEAAQVVVQQIELREVEDTGRWMPKTKAAKEAGITLEQLRGWCNRDRSPQPTRWVGGRQFVNLDDVLRERDAMGRHRSGQRSPTETPGVQKARRKRDRKV